MKTRLVRLTGLIHEQYLSNPVLKINYINNFHTLSYVKLCTALVTILDFISTHCRNISKEHNSQI